MTGRVRGDDLKVRTLHHRPVKHERQGCREIGPGARQQDGGDHHNQRKQEIEGAVHPAGEVDDESRHRQVRQELEQRLRSCFLPEREQQDEEHGQRVPEQYAADEQALRDRRGSQASDGQLDADQEGDDDHPYLHQPGQPATLVKSCAQGHAFIQFTGDGPQPAAPWFSRPISRSSRTAACTAKSQFRPRPRPECR
jgi:hypothetical protein